MPTRPPTIEANPPEPSRKLAVRAQAAEKRVAKGKQALRLGQLLDDRNTGRLDDEVRFFRTFGEARSSVHLVILSSAAGSG